MCRVTSAEGLIQVSHWTQIENWEMPNAITIWTHWENKKVNWNNEGNQGSTLNKAPSHTLWNPSQIIDSNTACYVHNSFPNIYIHILLDNVWPEFLLSHYYILQTSFWHIFERAGSPCLFSFPLGHFKKLFSCNSSSALPRYTFNSHSCVINSMTDWQRWLDFEILPSKPLRPHNGDIRVHVRKM